MRMKATGFDTQVAERLEIGAREYGDRSYSRPLRDLLVEMTEECADIAAWGSIALAAHPDDAEAEGSDPLRGALRPPSVAAAAERDRAHGMGSVSATDNNIVVTGLAETLANLDEAALRALADALRPYLLDAEPEPDALLTPQEAARRASVHVETIRRAVRSGSAALEAGRARGPHRWRRPQGLAHSLYGHACCAESASAR